MNILLTNDDGPGATGLRCLGLAARKCWANKNITTIVPARSWVGASYSVTPDVPWDHWRTLPAVQISNHTFTLDLSPVDLIYRAFHSYKEFTDRPFDLVVVGVNHGLNLGFDVFHSGTCAMATTAAAGFGAAAWALSQQLPDPTSEPFTADLPDAHFTTAERILPDFMRKTQAAPGECWNVNFPILATKGYKSTHTAHYSYYREPPLSLVPRAHKEDTDVTAIKAGFVAITQLVLRTNPSLRY